MEIQNFFVLVLALAIISIVPPVVAYWGAKSQLFFRLRVYMIALSVGVMLGMVWLHLIPEAMAHDHGIGYQMMGLIIAVAMFVFLLLDKLIHLWQHHRQCSTDCPSTFTTMTLIGDALHNFMDGFVLGASFLAGIPMGIQTSLAVFAHEFPQEVGTYATLLHGGYDRKKALWTKIFTALAILPSAVLMFWVGGHFFHEIEVFLVPITAGAFLYIALVDLLPEVWRKYQHSLRSICLCFLMMMIGFGLIFLIEHFGGHSHTH